MFKFLFGAKDKKPEVKRETQRETVLRAQQELNDILASLSPKAKITIYPEEGTFTIALPEQMPDEAKALPSPAKPEDNPETPPTQTTEAA